MIKKEQLDIVKYIDNRTGKHTYRIYIGLVCISDVYTRISKGDLFNEQKIIFHFYINQYKKYLPENEWLVNEPDENWQVNVNSLDEGVDWLLTKLNTV